MRNCQGLHCDGCRHGGGAGLGIGALLVLLGVLLYAAHHKAIDHAASDTAHVLVDVLFFTAVALTVTAVTTGTVWAVRAHQRARQVAARSRAAVAPPQAWVVQPPATARPAIEARRPVLRMLPVPFEREIEERR